MLKSSQYKTYSPNRDDLKDVEKSLSKDRFDRYLAATGGDRKKALYLYAWNTAACAAFYAPLQALEVTLRNQIHERLTEKYGLQWYDRPVMKFSKKNIEQLEVTKSNLKRSFTPIYPPDVIADLSFGFWVDLFRNDYEENLWRPALHKIFLYYGNSIKRKEVLKRLTKLKRFRNRIAHHEPIFEMGVKKTEVKGVHTRKKGIKNLKIYYQEILETIGWMSSGKRAWIEAHSRIEEVLAQPQTKPGIRF